MILADVEVEGRRVDVVVRDGTVTSIAPPGSATVDGHEEVVPGGGGALLPGLHDHHVHLLARAAALASVDVAPHRVGDEAGLRAALASAPRPQGWVRAVGYHEAVAGPLDADRLEAWSPAVPVRVQDRTGATWTLNRTALDLVPWASAPGDGVERDGAGRPTGRFVRLDGWLRDHVPDVTLDLAAVGAEAAGAGITGFTDADPDRDPEGLALLAAACRSGALPQRVTVMGPVGMVPPAPLRLGPVKVLADDEDLPPVPELAALARRAHADGRALAVHCVTHLQLVATAAALEDAGPVGGDRVEHGALIAAPMLRRLARLGVTVVTQPGFVATRGDRYRREVSAEDQHDLWRLASLAAAGVAVAGSSDMPHGDPDPWLAVRAAVERRAPDGEVLGPDERIDPRAALALYLGSAPVPDRPRRVVAGAPADLCLLAAPLAEVLRRPSADLVVGTWVGGRRFTPA